MQKMIIIKFGPDGDVGVMEHGCAWIDLLAALAAISNITRQKMHRPDEEVDRKISIATSREFAKKFAREAN